MFLTGNELSEKIKEVVSGPNARLAVAFWGTNAVKDLKLKGRQDIRIICDISMGGTNPKELTKLGAPTNKNLKHCDNFHAKVYLSDAAAIVTSANASNNGIGFGGGGANLVEAGYFIENTSEIAAWFEDKWKESMKVDDSVLEKCLENWDARKNAFDYTDPNAQPMQLLDALITKPGRLRSVGFIFTDENMSDTYIKKANDELQLSGLIVSDNHDHCSVGEAREFKHFIHFHHVKPAPPSITFHTYFGFSATWGVVVSEWAARPEPRIWAKLTNSIIWPKKGSKDYESIIVALKSVKKDVDDGKKWAVLAVEVSAWLNSRQVK